MLLEARDVTKAFGSFKAVDAASVTLEQGDILGLIGPERRRQIHLLQLPDRRSPVDLGQGVFRRP